MLLLGLDQVGHGHGVRLGPGVGADLAHELVVDGQVDVVAQRAFLAVDAVGRIRVGGAAQAIGTFLLGRALADLLYLAV